MSRNPYRTPLSTFDWIVGTIGWLLLVIGVVVGLLFIGYYIYLWL